MERLAMHDSLARTCVAMVQRGEWTREEALITLAFGLYESKRRFFETLVEKKNTEASDFIMTQDGKRYDRTL